MEQINSPSFSPRNFFAKGRVTPKKNVTARTKKEEKHNVKIVNSARLCLKQVSIHIGKKKNTTCILSSTLHNNKIHPLFSLLKNFTSHEKTLTLSVYLWILNNNIYFSWWMITHERTKKKLQSGKYTFLTCVFVLVESFFLKSRIAPKTQVMCSPQVLVRKKIFGKIFSRGESKNQYSTLLSR